MQSSSSNASKRARGDGGADSANAARAKFLKELQQFASDEEEDAHAYASSSRPRLESTTTATASDKASASNGNFFDGTDDAIVEDRAPPPRSVGMQLLQGMHKTGNTGGARSQQGGAGGLKVVEAYVPLSSGGFLDTGAEHAAGRPVKIGDVMCCVALRVVDFDGSPPYSPLSGHSSPTARPPTTAYPQSQQQQQQLLIHAHRSKSPERHASPYASPTTTAPVESPSAVMATAQSGGNPLRHFRAEADMTDEEKKFGKRLNHTMVQQLCEVTRWDAEKRIMEVLFLDGTRAKLGAHEVKPAGFVERALFQQWKQDPASRPVRTISAGYASPAPSCSSVDQNSSVAAPLAAAASAASAQPWWVLPNLVVRITAGSAGEWLGRKCVVVSIKRKENTVRLADAAVWQQQQQGAPTAAAAGLPANAVVDVAGVEGLETVLPKKDGSGMVVLGEHRGEMVTVVARMKDASGELARLSVMCQRTKKLLEVEPHEVCLMARRT